MSENDQISFGLGPELADVRNQDTYVFTVTRQDFIELDDSDDDNDKDVQIAEPTDGENECCDVGDLQITPVDELEGQSVETHEPKEQENCKSKEKGNSTSQSHSKDPVLGISKLQELKERQESLRHWNISKPPIIDPLPMKIGRRKKQPVSGQPSEVNPQCASKKKRGPVPKDRKEKLAALVKPVEEKTTEPKPRRGLKIKLTKNNRGNFLIVPPADQKSSSDTDKDWFETRTDSSTLSAICHSEYGLKKAENVFPRPVIQLTYSREAVKACNVNTFSNYI